jgi:hypothetical protein
MTRHQKPPSILDKPVSPFKQAIAVYIIGLVFIGLSSVFPMSPQAKMASAMPWVVACAMILFFALANSVLALATRDSQKYWLQSIISFALLFTALCLTAWGVSGIGMDEAGSIRWVLTVFTFGYLVLLSIVNLIKLLVFLAERSDAKKKESENW